ncbi:hypothetical protein ES703_60994 [subsurface metagenome]
MLEQVHKHIISELQQNTRTDIIFIIAAFIPEPVSFRNKCSNSRKIPRRYQPTYCNVYSADSGNSINCGKYKL